MIVLPSVFRVNVEGTQKWLLREPLGPIPPPAWVYACRKEASLGKSRSDGQKRKDHLESALADGTSRAIGIEAWSRQ